MLKKIFAVVLAVAMIASFMPTLAFAARSNELEGAPIKGIADTINAVNQLDSTKKALFVGAHPDDENNSLLVYLNRKLGADVVYADANWGEGGDNSIGTELYGALGVLRSQELKSSRLFDGAEQMYFGAYDFGYSVSLYESLLGDAETKAAGIWNIDVLGYNLAKTIRITKPQVIFSHHKAPNSDHGQHRGVGWLIEYAMDLAADASYTITENGVKLDAWQVSKYFASPYTASAYSKPILEELKDQITAVGEKSSVPADAGQGLVIKGATPDMVLDLGEYDSNLAMSYAEWGIIGRNMHKCQKMLGIPVKGESLSRWILKKAAPNSNVKGEFSSTVFGGTPGEKGISDLGKLFPQNTNDVTALEKALTEFKSKFDTKNVTANAALLATAKATFAKLAGVATFETQKAMLKRIEKHVDAVITDIFALSVDVTVDDNDVVPGQTVKVTAKVMARNATADLAGIPAKGIVDGKPVAITVPAGFKVEEVSVTDLKSGDKVVGRDFVYNVTIPADYKGYTGPYNAPYNEGYTNPNYPHGSVPKVNTLPKLTQDPAAVTAAMVKKQTPEKDIKAGITVKVDDPYSKSPIMGSYTAKVAGVTLTVVGEPQLRVVPKITALVSNESSMLKFTGKEIKSTIDVVIKNNTKGEAANIVVTAAPKDKDTGIKVDTQTITIAGEGQTKLVTLNVTVPASFNNKGTTLVVGATYNGELFYEGYEVIDYSHIETKNYYKLAAQSLTVTQYDLVSDDIKIGYLMSGADDFVFDYIKGMYSDAAKADANLKVIGASDISKSGAELYKQFDTIIVGKTALPDQSPISPALKANMQNLLDFANAGGNLVVHYQNYREDNKMPFAPAPFELGSSNINKEDSDVYISDKAAATPFYAGLDLMRGKDNKSSSDIWDGWMQQRCEWTPGNAGAGQPEAMEALGYTVLFAGQDPEGQPRPAILYKEMNNGGHYTYSAVVWERQLQNLTPGAYKLYANLISMGYKKK